MKLKHLESILSSLPNKTFVEPKITLEQYPTSAQLTASIILTALDRGDAGPGTSILDLGTGTGMLGLGMALVQSDMVYLVDCDEDALELARENVNLLKEEELIGRSSEDEEDDEEDVCLGVELLLAKVKYTPPKRNNMHGGGGRGRGRGHRGGRGKKGRGRGNVKSNNPTNPTAQDNDNNTLYNYPNENDTDDGIPLPSKIVDTVITNPPFGTKHNEGIDVQFLKTAIRLAKRAVYSFHKTSTRPFLLKLLKEKWNLNAEVVAEMKFDIKNMYKFHKDKSKDVEVDLLRIWWDDEEEEPKEEILEEEYEESEGEEMPLGLCGHA